MAPKLRPGSVGITVRERLTPKQSRYSYAFRAHAGQKLTWAFSGPAVRTVLRNPTGDSEGPGLPEIIPLPSSGTSCLRSARTPWQSISLARLS